MTHNKKSIVFLLVTAVLAIAIIVSSLFAINLLSGFMPSNINEPITFKLNNNNPIVAFGEKSTIFPWNKFDKENTITLSKWLGTSKNAKFNEHITYLLENDCGLTLDADTDFYSYSLVDIKRGMLFLENIVCGTNKGDYCLNAVLNVYKIGESESPTSANNQVRGYSFEISSVLYYSFNPAQKLQDSAEEISDIDWQRANQYVSESVNNALNFTKNMVSKEIQRDIYSSKLENYDFASKSDSLLRYLDFSFSQFFMSDYQLYSKILSNYTTIAQGDMLLVVFSQDENTSSTNLDDQKKLPFDLIIMYSPIYERFCGFNIRISQ